MATTVSPAVSPYSPIRHGRESSQTYPVYHYPPVPKLQQPPPAALRTHSRRQSEAYGTNGSRIQGSISSAESGRSGMVNIRQQSSSPSYWGASNMEQGLVNEHTVRSWSPPSQRYSPSHPPSRQEMADNNSAIIQYLAEKQIQQDAEEEEEDHAIWILFWLSCLDPIHSAISAIYTILVVITLTLVSPIRLCQSQATFGDQLIRSLAPIFRHHLELLKAPSVVDSFHFQFKPFLLVLIQLSSPILSLGVMIATWISAAFWLFALIMGNPDGTEKQDDGRATVISVRNWWERYLLNAIDQQ